MMKKIRYYVVIVLMFMCSNDLFSQKLCDFNCDLSVLYLNVIRDEFGDSIFNNLLKSNYRAHFQFRYIGKYDLYEIYIDGERPYFLKSNTNYFNRFKNALKRQPYLPAGSFTNNDIGSFMFSISFSKITKSWNKQKTLLDYAKLYLDSVARKDNTGFNRKFNIESTATNKCERFPVDSLRYTNNKELFEYYILNVILNTEEKYIDKLIDNKVLGYLQTLTFFNEQVSSTGFDLEVPLKVLDFLEMDRITSNLDNQPYKYVYIKERDELRITHFYAHKIDCSRLVQEFYKSESNKKMSLVEFAKEYIPKRYAELELEWECKENNKQNSQNDIVSKTGNNIGFAGITIIQIFILLVIVIIVCGGILLYKKIRNNKA